MADKPSCNMRNSFKQAFSARMASRIIFIIIRSHHVEGNHHFKIRPVNGLCSILIVYISWVRFWWSCICPTQCCGLWFFNITITIRIRIQRFQKSQSGSRYFKNHNPDPDISKIPIRIKRFQKSQSVFRDFKNPNFGSRDFKNPNPDPEILKIRIRIKRFQKSQSGLGSRDFKNLNLNFSLFLH